MKSIFTLLSFVFLSITGFSQYNVYLYGFMENAPQQPVTILATFNSNPPLTVTLQTESNGNIPTQGFFVSDDWNTIQTSFVNCNGELTTQSWADSTFENLVDIPFYLNYCPDTTGVIYGCTDPEALNYDPQATMDNGTCVYSSDCDLNLLSVIIQTQNWGDEISWSILNDSTEIATGSNYSDFTTTQSNLCLEDGCYTFQMFDSYGDGWNGGTYQLILDNTVIQSGTLEAPSFGQIAFGINQDGCEVPPVWGCTDPMALNYNPYATADDGSCQYPEPPVANDLCANAIPLSEGSILIDNTNATQNEGIWGECWGFGQGEGEQSSLWYTFTTPDVPASIHLETSYDGTNTLTDTQFGIFDQCGGAMIYCDGNGGEGLMSALNFACGELQQNTTYILMVDGWSGDIGTCYLTYSVDTTCTTQISGCTDPQALNYNPDATIDDGSCFYETNCTPVHIVFDGIGFPSGGYVLASQDTVIQAGDYTTGSDYYIDACLTDGCYTLSYYSTSEDSLAQVYFTIFANNQAIQSGIFGNWIPNDYTQFSIGGGCDSTNVIYGCTDPTALNYNPNANVDDGSCQYEEVPCQSNEVILTINTVDWAAEMSWMLWKDGVFVEAGGNYQNDNTYTYTWCLEDGCYLFEMMDSYGDGWNGGTYLITYNDSVLSSGTLASGLEYGSVQFGVNEEGCAPAEIYGCTDPTAINYNPEATSDDGSCIYISNCNISFTVLPDSIENVVWILPSGNITDAVSVLWDFGDGITSTEFFPQHTYEDEGPYTLCLTVSFALANNDSCSVTYCTEVSGAGLDGPGFGPNGFTINVTNNSNPTGIDGRNIERASIDLWPNPVTDQLSIRFTNPQNLNTSLTIYDIAGKLLIQKSLMNSTNDVVETVDVKDLPSGMYIIKVSNSKTTQSGHFVKTN